VASSVVALDDGRYGIATLRFPDVDGDDMTLEVAAVQRQASGAPRSQSHVRGRP
jgi:hypothetical protein